MIDACNAYIYQIYAKEEKNIDNQLFYINKAISIWPEQRFGKNKSLLQDKGNFLINKGNEEFRSKHYNNAKDISLNHIKFFYTFLMNNVILLKKKLKDVIFIIK